MDGRRRREDWKNNNRGKNAVGEESEWECLGPKTKSLEFTKTTSVDTEARRRTQPCGSNIGKVLVHD